jgi:hypothetical protein
MRSIQLHKYYYWFYLRFQKSFIHSIRNFTSMTRIYFTSYYPLCHTAHGRAAADMYNLKPYRDGSCRLEPDFEKKYPCITSICRPGFSKNLKVGNIVIYATNKNREGHKYLIAILEVIKKVSTHEEAKKWYEKHHHDLPQNLMVSPNEPIPLNQTHNKKGWTQNHKIETLKEWDESYRKKILSTNSNVAICEVKYIELERPHLFDDPIQDSIFGTIHGTQNYYELTDMEWNKLLKFFNDKNIAYEHELVQW